jgi:multidrug transporter EmrE-like cation transporter
LLFLPRGSCAESPRLEVLLKLITFIIAIASISLNSLAQICLRKTMLVSGPVPKALNQWLTYGFDISVNPWMIAGLGCYGISILLWMAVLSKVEVSAAYPLTSIGFIITAAAGFFFLGETVSISRATGIALVCCGVVLITRG